MKPLTKATQQHLTIPLSPAKVADIKSVVQTTLSYTTIQDTTGGMKAIWIKNMVHSKQYFSRYYTTAAKNRKYIWE
jgi:hypothetical protein